MSTLEQMLFLLQKSQVMSWFFGVDTKSFVSAPYAYAWYEGVFPILDESAEWHAPYANHFKISESLMDELHSFLCDCWDGKKDLSFYDLEAHYGVRGSTHDGPYWSRFTLCHACKYFYLHEIFDDNFWNTLLENGKSPAEARSISAKFKSDQLYLV